VDGRAVDFLSTLQPRFKNEAIMIKQASHHSILLVAAPLLLTGLLSAQRGALWTPPGLSSDSRDPAWDFSQNPVLKSLTSHPNPLWAISGHKMPGDPAGTFTICFTIRALVQPWNPGFSGFLIAKWTPGAKTPLVLTPQANDLNEAFIDYNLNLEPVRRNHKGRVVGGGRVGVFDRFQFGSSGLEYVGAYLATRKDDRSNFGKARKISGLVGMPEYADPTLGYVDGRLKLFYTSTQKALGGKPVFGIWMQDLDAESASGPRVRGRATLVAKGNDRGVGKKPWLPHSPNLVHGADGDVEGMFLAEGEDDTTFQRSDLFFAADLDPATPHALTLASKGWIASGGLAGGTLLVNDSEIVGAPRVAEGAWLVGDRVARGERADVTLTAFAEPGSRATTVLFAGRWLRQPVQLPGVFGQSGVFGFPIGIRKTNKDQQAHFRVRMPRFAPRGWALPIQGLSIHRSGGKWIRTLTNTATIRVR